MSRCLACALQNPAKIKDLPVFAIFRPLVAFLPGFGRFRNAFPADGLPSEKNNQQKEKIMANQPFYPKREGDQSLWFTNIQSKIPKYCVTLEISDARKAKLTLVLNWLIWAWHIYLPARRADAPAATAWRQQLATGTGDATTDCTPPEPAALTPPADAPFFGMLSWLFDEIGRWKKAEGYTDTIGADLGIVGSSSQTHTDPPQLAQGDVAENSVELDATFWEHNGVYIESQRQGEAGFAFLAVETSSPYMDNRAVKTAGQAEWRDYRACWWDNDTPSMHFGPVLRVLVSG
ncbi:MAG TPA: hypothetical protein VMV89_09765 [Candidatus Paceibacterota bacterium]|nr:hypothetical protein [Candidatus Paceibacterota bacterium]